MLINKNAYVPYPCDADSADNHLTQINNLCLCVLFRVWEIRLCFCIFTSLFTEQRQASSYEMHNVQDIYLNNS